MLKVEFDFEWAVLYGTITIAIIAIVLLMFDIQYFIRMAFVVIWGKLFENKLHPEDVSTIYGKHFY